MTKASEFPTTTLAAAAAVMLVPLAFHASHAVASLQASRAALQRLRWEVRDTAPLSPADRSAARARYLGHIRGLSLQFGVKLGLVSNLAAAADDLTALSIDVSGSQTAVLAFADALESGARTSRFRRWRLRSTADGVRLTGTVATPLKAWR